MLWRFATASRGPGLAPCSLVSLDPCPLSPWPLGRSGLVGVEEVGNRERGAKGVLRMLCVR